MKLKKYVQLFTVLVLSFAGINCSSSDSSLSNKEKSFFTNPIAQKGADPWVVRSGGYYYYCFSRNQKIWVARSEKLQDIGNVAPSEVWSAVPGTNYSAELWAPELHLINGKWYIYVAADNGDNNNHRMYVLEGSSVNPQDKFSLKGKLAAPVDKWAIDGTVLLTDDNKLYFIWSGWQGDKNVKQDLYIAPMSNPWTISGDRVRISTPELDWEKRGGDPLINEGPEVLKHNGKIYIIYSASGSWSDYYCLGQLTFSGSDILNKDSWTKKPVPVFQSTDSVISPGHASFVKSPDGKEDWIVYHTARKKGAGWDRVVRIQKFNWNTDGTPDFGSPLPNDAKIAVPSE